jgi:hypothetical protein
MHLHHSFHINPTTMFRHLSSLQRRNSSMDFVAPVQSLAHQPSLAVPPNHLSYLPWNHSSFSVASSIFLAELYGDTEWNSISSREEEQSWSYLDEEHIAAAAEDIAHGEVFEYVEGVVGRELTEREVYVISSGRRGSEDSDMPPGFYAEWLERHRDLVDEEGKLRDEPTEGIDDRRCETRRSRTVSQYPIENARGEKGLFWRLSKIWKRRST